MKLQGMKASLVYDGGDRIIIPKELGTPRPDQMCGTLIEQVVELAVRICYESLGKKRARSTEDNLKHILDVKHWSTMEHPQKTIEMKVLRNELGNLALALLNRPGIWVRYCDYETPFVRITTNVRTVLEWDIWTAVLKKDNPGFFSAHADCLGKVLKALWSEQCPLLLQLTEYERDIVEHGWDDLQDLADVAEARFVEPETDQEKWVSLYMQGSRGFTHEQVRHGDFTAVSQRSTRYCGESGTAWGWHPLIMKYLKDQKLPVAEREEMHNKLHDVRNLCIRLYSTLVSRMQPWLKEQIDEIDPEGPYNATSARKQARGAARGVLGNALQSNMIFSASVGQWKHMLNMRGADAADAEIRMIYTQERESVLTALRESRYADCFDDISLEPASDGIGLALAGGGHK